MFGIISRQQRPWGEKPMGNRAGIDDSGDPLWASLIQNRVRDNTWVEGCPSLAGARGAWRISR